MAEIPVPAGYGVPLIDQTTFKLPQQMLDALGLDSSGQAATPADFDRAALLGRLAPIGYDLSSVTLDQPTITHTTSSTLTGRPISVGGAELTTFAARGSQTGNGAYQVDGQLTGREFYVDGDFEISWTEWGPNATCFVFTVDGVKTHLAPVRPSASALGNTTAGAGYFTKLAWAAPRRRRIGVYASYMNLWSSIRVGNLTSISPVAAKPLWVLNSDSYAYGWTISSVPFGAVWGIGLSLGLLLGVDMHIAALGGQGYVIGSETFGSATRIARGMNRGIPEGIFHNGSSNDDAAAAGTVYTAAMLCYSAWAAAAPGVPQFVAGPPATNASATISAGRWQTNNELRQAANDHPAVVGFIDQLGAPETGGQPAAWDVGTVYTAGTTVTHLGSYWRMLDGVTGTPAGIAPGASARWELRGGLLWGTGRVGATAGVGSRDLLLSSDTAHPEFAYALAIAQRHDRELRALLAA